MSMGSKVRELREASGWDQYTLAEQSGLSKGYISLLESGHRRPRLDTVRKLAKAFDITVAELYIAAGDVDTLSAAQFATLVERLPIGELLTLKYGHTNPQLEGVIEQMLGDKG